MDYRYRTINNYNNLWDIINGGVLGMNQLYGRINREESGIIQLFEGRMGDGISLRSLKLAEEFSNALVDICKDLSQAQYMQDSFKVDKCEDCVRFDTCNNVKAWEVCEYFRCQSE